MANREERRKGMSGKPSLWASANSAAKGRLLEEDKVKMAKKALTK